MRFVAVDDLQREALLRLCVSSDQAFQNLTSLEIFSNPKSRNRAALELTVHPVVFPRLEILKIEGDIAFLYLPGSFKAPRPFLLHSALPTREMFTSPLLGVNLKHLSIRNGTFRSSPHFGSPSVASFPSLDTLELIRDGTIFFPVSFHFPNLKKLYIKATYLNEIGFLKFVSRTCTLYLGIPHDLPIILFSIQISRCVNVETFRVGSYRQGVNSTLVAFSEVRNNGVVYLPELRHLEIDVRTKRGNYHGVGRFGADLTPERSDGDFVKSSVQLHQFLERRSRTKGKPIELRVFNTEVGDFEVSEELNWLYTN